MQKWNPGEIPDTERNPLSNPGKAQTVESRTELVEYLASGCKPESRWKLGTEHEKFGYTMDDLRPLPYAGERGIGALLAGVWLLTRS